MFSRERINKIVQYMYDKNIVQFVGESDSNVDIDSTISTLEIERDLEYNLRDENNEIDDTYKIALGYVRKVRKTDKTEDIYMWVRDDMLENNRKFTLAHELGHAILHILLQDNEELFADAVYFRKKSFQYGQEESEADEFARLLLMPTDKFTEFFYNNIEDNEIDMEVVADKFGVSIGAAISRARYLGLIY